MVTVQPLRLSSLNISGIAVISLDFFSQATCVSVRPFSLAQAVTECNMALPDYLAIERRSALLSMLMTFPPVASGNVCVH